MPVSIINPITATSTIFDGDYVALSTANMDSAGNKSKILYLNSSGVLEWLSFADTNISNLESYATTTNFPVTGESAVLYFAQDTSKWYRWSGSAYVDIHTNLLYKDGTSTMAGNLQMGAYDIQGATNIRSTTYYNGDGSELVAQWQAGSSHVKLNDETKTVNLKCNTVKGISSTVAHLSFTAGPELITVGANMAMGGFNISNGGTITGSAIAGPLYSGATKYLEYDSGTSTINCQNKHVDTGTGRVVTSALRTLDWQNGAGTSLISTNGTTLTVSQPFNMGSNNITTTGDTKTGRVLTNDWVNNAGTQNLIGYNGTQLVFSRPLYINSQDITSLGNVGAFTMTGAINANSNSITNLNTVHSVYVKGDSFYRLDGTARVFYLDGTNSNMVMDAGNIILKKYPTSGRPTPIEGMQIIDQDLNKLLVYVNSAWRDGSGASV